METGRTWESRVKCGQPGTLARALGSRWRGSATQARSADLGCRSLVQWGPGARAQCHCIPGCPTARFPPEEGGRSAHRLSEGNGNGSVSEVGPLPASLQGFPELWGMRPTLPWSYLWPQRPFPGLTPHSPPALNGRLPPHTSLCISGPCPCLPSLPAPRRGCGPAVGSPGTAAGRGRDGHLLGLSL